MACLVKLTWIDPDDREHEIWVNLDTVQTLTPRARRTQVSFGRGEFVTVTETPEAIAHLAVSESPLGVGR